MFNLKDGYLGFTFNGHHSSEFGLMVVSDGDRYHQTLSPSFADTIVSVPGRNGGYYFGTQMQMKDFTIRCAFNEMTTHMLHKIEQWLYPNQIGWLIFDETPYKKYWVKISNIIEPTYIPFDKVKVIKKYTIQQEIVKGELQISFFSFNEYGIYNEEYEVPDIINEEIIKQQVLDSGLIPNNYCHEGFFLPHDKTESITTSNLINPNFLIYNAGNGIAKADFYFTISKDAITNSEPLEIFNYEDGESYIITNPESIVSKKVDLEQVENYEIKILGTKGEVWLHCNGLSTNEDINIGGCYNHYFPKIYHKKPTEIMIMTQNFNNIGYAEPLFFPYSYGDPSLYSSDSLGEYDSSFEEIKNTLTDYIIVTKTQTIEINDKVGQTFLYVNQEDTERESNQLVYFIYPNRYFCNKNITNFVAEYKHTYI